MRTSQGNQFYDLGADPWETYELLARGPLTPEQQKAYARLSRKLTLLLASSR